MFPFSICSSLLGFRFDVFHRGPSRRCRQRSVPMTPSLAQPLVSLLNGSWPILRKQVSGRNISICWQPFMSWQKTHMTFFCTSFPHFEFYNESLFLTKRHSLPVKGSWNTPTLVRVLAGGHVQVRQGHSACSIWIFLQPFHQERMRALSMHGEKPALIGRHRAEEMLAHFFNLQSSVRNPIVALLSHSQWIGI